MPSHNYVAKVGDFRIQGAERRIRGVCVCVAIEEAPHQFRD